MPRIRFSPGRYFARNHAPLNRGFYCETWLLRLESSSVIRLLPEDYKLNHKKFDYCPLVLLPYVATMQARCMAECGSCISPRAAQVESFFESRESLKYSGFEYACLSTKHAGGGGRIRTICVIS